MNRLSSRAHLVLNGVVKSYVFHLWLAAGLAFLSLANGASIASEAEWAATGLLMIHEFSADADAEQLVDEDGEAVDWLEIHNRSETAVALEGWHLSDDAEAPMKWPLPAIELASGGYLLVHASGKDRRNPGQPLHTNFKLDAGGEFLALTDAEGGESHVFAPEFPKQRRGLTYGWVAATEDFRFFSTPTPGEANSGKTFCYVGDTKFSVDRGFYDAPFKVEITCDTPGAKIRYTTDGNEPTIGTLFGGAYGTEYTGPITISETTVLRAYATLPGWQASNVDTQTYLFLDDVIHQSPDGESPPGWPEGSVKGQRFDFGMDPEVVNDPDYADQILPALRSLPSMSLAVDQDDLTGSKGFYVNPREDGRAWERPGSLELLHPDGTKGFQTNAGFRIRGGFSRDTGNPKHSFRVFFREEYGDGTLNYPLFGDEGADAFKKF
ncbi:MAG: chitobiase/beta-hexosaminidase C-terminal domain-containing protein, partial [Verrucomicrobiota bacterium]